MEKNCKKILFSLFPIMLRERFPQFEEYKGTKEEFKFFLTGTRVFRALVDEQVYVYMLLMPGERSTTIYDVSLGWGFGQTIAPFNYLQQIRELENKAIPSERFDSGFFTLGKIEGKSSGMGEQIIADPNVEIFLDALEGAVMRSLSTVFDRLKVQLPLFVKKITESSNRRNIG